MKLTERQNKILTAIVEEYINTGEPVGSKFLHENLNLGVSSATIRNEMAQLYEMGYLEQPHTSAGRVPSHIGIREYIDSLMEYRPLSEDDKSEIDSLFNVKNPDPDKILGDAADALSDYTGYASVTSSLVGEKVQIKSLEYIIAGDNTVVIILVANNGVIRSKVVRVDFNVTPELMNFFHKFSNARFVGKGIEAITRSYVSAVSLTLGQYSRIFTSLLLAIYELCQEISQGRYYVSGGTKLLTYNDEVSQLARDLLMLIENQENLQKLFGREFARRVIVGKENLASELTDSSVVITTYKVGGEPAGTVGLIGPMRLDYSRVIPHLEYFAYMLGDLLDDTLEPSDE